jgi:hypothetical protein
MSIETKVVEVAVGQVKGYLYPTEAERAAAYELLIELSTRTAGAQLASTNGSIRDELDSIAEMFGLTREILRRHGTETVKGGGGNLSLAVVAIRVLNEVFRPVLSRWDPILRDHEDRRATDDPGTTAIEWERRWERAGQCRIELNTMRSSVRAYIDTLSRIAGASAIADAVLSAPTSVMFPVTTFPFDAPSPAVPAHVKPRLKMVRWLAPIEMFQTWRSGLGIEHSLKLVDKPFVPSPDGASTPTARFDAQPGEDFWFDYVADMGDGFDGTAPVAWLAGRRGIDLPDDRFGDLPTPPKPLRRGQLLVFGGDQIYPFAKQGAYEAQVELPYQMGFEPDDPDAPSGQDPTLVAIPGNHDWLGGIGHFVSMFVSGRRFAGHWNTVQSENWWHVKLPQGWWLWGIDTALDNELVGAQRAYFTEAAKALKQGDRVIVCTPVPLWQLRQKYRDAYAALRNVFDPLIVGSGATMPLCLSGDSHFFAHLERLDADFEEDHVTAGGGGAFLQPTHNLPERIPLEGGNAEFALRHRWPLPAESRAIAPGGRKVFDPQYRPILLLIGLLFLGLTAATVIPWPNLTSDTLPTPRSWMNALRWTVSSPWVLLLLVVICGVGVVAVRGNSVEPKLTGAARVYGLLMGAGLAGALVVVAATRAFLVGWETSGSGPDETSARGLGDSDWLWPSIAIAAVVGAFVGLVVFLTLLKWTNARIKAADTLAFSPAYSTRYKHFLRFRIDREGDLTCYAIGIDPVGEGWFEAMTSADSTPSSVPPHDPAGIPRLYYVWGKTYRKFTPVPLEIAVSISDPDPNRDRAAPDKLVESFEHLSASLIHGGHTLLYGGIPDTGFTTRLHQVELRVHADNPNPKNRVVNYVADGLWTDDHGPWLMQRRRVRRTPKGPESDVERLIGDLTEMRRHVTARADVRIVVGGDLQPGSPRSRLAPGVLQEAYLSISAGQPVIVLGGFGGAGRLIADALLGCADPAEVDRLAEHFVMPVADPDGGVPVGFGEMLSRMNSLGVLRNGLTDGENVELLRTDNVITATHLVRRSVQRIGSHHVI